MNSFIVDKTKINQKDIEKGQKIVAAVYLLTNHLSESEPLRESLRRSIISLILGAKSQDQSLLLFQTEILLGSAVLSGLITDKNSSIVIYEAKQFCKNINEDDNPGAVESLFGHSSLGSVSKQTAIKDTKKTFSHGLSQLHQGLSTPLSYSKNYQKNILNKDSRQNKILSFINERKSAVIKDIVSLFPEVSEKTIQRELNTLIASGKITKRGSKRWSMYMAVNQTL